VTENHTYEDGIREGRLRALEVAREEHASLLDKHNQRLTAQERITYSLIGALVFVQIWPSLQEFLSK